MLQNLHVKNMALIDEVEIELQSGLNILTGETGAGKSIIIDSIGFALGEKADKNLVRDPDEASLVELTFVEENKTILHALSEAQIEVEDGVIILSRKISNGRTIAKINGESVPASKLKEIASLLIDIHGQHEHQSLLHASKHLNFLDEFAKNEIGTLKDELAKAYTSYRQIQKELEEGSLDQESRARELSLLEYELHEIESANLKTGEDEELETEYRKIGNSKKIIEALQEVSQLMGERGAADAVARSVRELMSVSALDEDMGSLCDQISDIEQLISDFGRELSGYIDALEYDEERVLFVETRLDELNHLKAKYGTSIDAVIASMQERQQRIDKLLNYAEYEQNLKAEYEKARQELEGLCQRLSDIRHAAGEQFKQQMIAALSDLNFLDVRFDLDFQRLDHFTGDGFESMEFLISTNPGAPLRKLKDIASGGELSRIMLAFKSILASQDEIDTLIFDEIDTGISGRTAQMVSEKMNVIAKNHQVICITHLPQIAAMADAHFFIEKNVIDNSTVTDIHLLDQEESIAELGRMLGGVEVTETVLQSAREMKELAGKKK
ncbi:MAG: DNA repair protein RecN [Lachnospiraceae bacterium]|nr:DNA repair protein RecN [Lachnospiraceae bacterium]